MWPPCGSLTIACDRPSSPGSFAIAAPTGTLRNLRGQFPSRPSRGPAHIVAAVRGEECCVTGSGDSANANPLPLTADGLTAMWLSEGLRTRFPGVVITQAEPVQLIEGTATKVLLRLAYGP